MQPIITENRDRIVELCKTDHVRSLSAFGSAVRDDLDPEKSDVDLLVQYAYLLREINADRKLLYAA